MSDLVGGCLCGKIRYASNAAPVMTALCTVRIARNRPEVLFQSLLLFPSRPLQ